MTPLATSDDSKKPAFGTITKFAQVPEFPGFPEGIAIDGNRVYVSGPARFGTAGTGPSAIQVFDRKSGQLVQTISVQGEALQFEHALSNIAIDCQGRIYALSTQLGMIRFKKNGKGFIQEAYGAPIPDLPPVNDPASPPLVNDIVFDELGFAYVTDSLQGAIHRYPPGGGVSQVWFTSPVLAGGGPIPFGPNGIRINPQRTHIYFVSSTSAQNPFRGTIYRLPLVNQPNANDLEVVYDYNQFELPDQLAFSEDGVLYVTLALSNQISILLPGVGELTRISSQPTDAVPLNNPAALAFDNRTKSLLVANHALLPPYAPQDFAVLKIYVADEGDELAKP